MAKRYKLKTAATDSLTAVSKDLKVGIDIQRTEKVLPDTNIMETIDEYEVFENERKTCDKYRLILTIKPYCSNVLFNTLTEIVRYEGDYNNVEVVTDTERANAPKEVGGPTDPTRNQMIMNTEYSKEDIGYEYHPGYDIFNNHIIRNTTFKMVNKSVDGNEKNSATTNWEGFKEITTTQDGKSDAVRFNTIGDTMRTKDGELCEYHKRVSLDDAPKLDLKRHLYLDEELLSMENGDAINNNLTEENGWYGFKNNSTISAEEREVAYCDDGYTIRCDDWNDMDISRVLNNHENCDFIDMYPDRSLYSFNPKYNSYQRRAEYNWHIEITYPYRNATNHPLVSNETNGDGKTNGLLILSIEKMDSIGDTPVLMVRTYCKHGLEQNDSVYFYYSEDEGNTFVRIENEYKVTRVGDMNGNNTDYFFYMTDLSLIQEVFGDEYLYDDYGNFKVSNSTINSALAGLSFRIRHYVNNAESEYYFRIFRKLPNLRARQQNLTQEIAESVEDFYEYTKENAVDKGSNEYKDGADGYYPLRDFNHEQYQLAFASTIYSDACTQITFTDALDAAYIVDNLGRPLTDLYITIVKNNAGYDNWYSSNPNYTDENNEYSHCFGRITSGLYYHTENGDNTDNLLNNRGEMSDVRVINNMSLFSSRTLGQYINDLESVYTTGFENINYQDNEFIGDVVEFIPCQAKEVVLSDVYHRFNTAQREIQAYGGTDNYTSFQYQEITADDYDLSDFTVTNYEIRDNVQRPEGYFYKAHYRLPIRDLGRVEQDAHKDIKVRSAKPIQLEGMYVQITSTLPHSLSMGDKVFICDDVLGEWYETNVIYVINELNFVIRPLDDIKWIKLCDILNSSERNKQFKVRGQNTDIPSYAVKVGNNTFLWRNILRLGDEECSLPDYVFANGYLYIEKCINFFLKRQDADGKNGLYNYAKAYFPNDVAGITETDDTYDYEDLEETVC